MEEEQEKEEDKKKKKKNGYCAMRILGVNEVTAVALTTTNSNKTGKLNCMYAMGTLLLHYCCYCAAKHI